MSKSKKRVYHSESRVAQAAQTRSRILVVAKNLFQTEGFELVTIENIAKAANVSTPTIYSLFQSKRGILRILMDEALPPAQRIALVEESKNEKLPTTRLQIAAKISRQMYDAERAQMEIFQGASILAPEFKELEREREQRRYQRIEVTIKTMIEEKSLTKDLSISRAHAIFWAFTGRDMYRMFVVERGWTPDEYEKWLGQLLIQNLIG